MEAEFSLGIILRHTTLQGNIYEIMKVNWKVAPTENMTFLF